MVTRCFTIGWGSALLSLLALTAPVGAHECAVLGTKQASDLAIDEPERFEALSRQCRGDAPLQSRPKSKPKAHSGAAAGGAGMARGGEDRDNRGGTKQVDSSADSESMGCPFLFYTVPGKVHRPDTETCQNDKNIVCRLDRQTGRSSWQPGGSACLNEPNRLKTYELNLRNTLKLKEDTKQMFE